MEKYFDAENFFEANMIKDFNSEKFKKITLNEIALLQKFIQKKDTYILDVMCGYGRLGNELYKLGYKNLFGIDIDMTNLIPEKRVFEFYNEDFYNWDSTFLYDFCYSLYNSYSNCEVFIDTINKCGLLLKRNGILIIDIFNKAWRDRLPNITHRVIKDNEVEKVELFRYYDGEYEKSVYKITSDCQTKEFCYSQCVMSKEKLLNLIPDYWDVTITDSKIENTREDDQKNILILRKKV